jgi:hypothetical protein
MSHLRPLKLTHFKVILIWWHCPFKQFWKCTVLRSNLNIFNHMISDNLIWRDGPYKKPFSFVFIINSLFCDVSPIPDFVNVIS